MVCGSRFYRAEESCFPVDQNPAYCLLYSHEHAINQPMPFNPANDLIDDAALGSSPSDNASGLPIPTNDRKKKKKSKKNNASKPHKWDEGEEPVFGTSITPSPPVHNGVPLREPTPPQSEPEPMTAGEEDDMMAWDTGAAPPPDLELEAEPGLYAPPEPEDVPTGLMDDFSEDVLEIDAPKQFTPPIARTLSPKGPTRLQSPRVQQPPQPTVPAEVPPSPTVRRALPVRSAEHDPGKRRTSVSERARRESFGQQRQHTPPRPRNNFVEPSNPPHMMQNHFFTLPGLDFGRSGAQQEKGGKQAGSDHYCCSFDSFANSGDASSAHRAKDALLVGWEGGLDVYRVLHDKMEIVGRLEGLRGGVVGAKILPSSGGAEQSRDLSPLVAVIVHGPMAAGDTAGPQEPDSQAAVTHYQTTVEIYSLRSQRHVSTLYKSLPVVLPEAVLGSLATVPAPVGDLHLDAQGRFLTIASGKSGEIFVFAGSQARPLEWDYAGKYWTTLQSRFDVQPRPGSSSEGTSEKHIPDPLTPPLMSLNSRWLAIVPPSSSSKVSVHASIAAHSQPPGASDHVAPTQPNPTLDVIGLNAEGVLAKYSRQAAQEILKASRRGIEMGMAGWKEFTQPSPPTKNTSQHTRAESGDGGFPPTNAPGEDKRRAIKQPAVVSIIDLERLSDAGRDLPSHMATFALGDGCNYLSFSEDGLHLLTTNRTGEVSHVWDLRHAAHAPSQISSMDNGEVILNAHVKRVHRIVRNTQAVVLDAIWARDGHFVALLTAHGTVHLHEVSPRTRETQRHRRRSTNVASAQLEKADATVGVSQGLSPPSSNGFLTSIRSGWQSVSTQVNTIRAGTANGSLGIPTTFAGFRETANAGAAMSGRAVARGLSQSYSVAKIGVGDIWHADDNKIRHKEFGESAAAGSIRWLRRRSGLSVAIACGGKVFLHPVQHVTRQRGESTFTGLKAEKSGKREFPLPNIATASVAPNSSCADQGPHGFWSLPAATPKRSTKSTSRMAEDDKTRYETNPPYCPLYIDRRVSMLGYDDVSTSSGADYVAEFVIKGHGFEEDEPWAFGEPLPAATKLNQQSAPSPASSFDASQHDDEEQEYNEDVGFDGAADQDASDAGVQSRIIVNPATSEIRINSSRSKRKKKQLGRPILREEKVDGDFELLEDDDEDALF